MKKEIIQIMAVFVLFLITIGISSVLADESTTADNMDVKQENAVSNNTLQSVLSCLKVSGGISAGYFYASNSGDEPKDQFLLSNFLVEISSTDETLPVSFIGAFGETSTPSLLDSPENNDKFKIEYAALILDLITDASLELGLLEPNAGFENTYTFRNMNVILGAVASQQPYNAYGGRLCYDMNDISLWGGYYKERLDDEEYNTPDYAWEIGLSGSISENAFTLYHYNIKGQRNLSGMIIERTIQNVDIGFNIDYWIWEQPNERFIW